MKVQNLEGFVPIQKHKNSLLLTLNDFGRHGMLTLDLFDKETREGSLEDLSLKPERHYFYSITVHPFFLLSNPQKQC